MPDDKYTTTPQSRKTIEALWKLQKIILNTLDYNQVIQKVTDDLLVELGYLNLGYRIIVLTLVNEKKAVLERISISQTDEAKKAQEASAVPFRQIEIPLNAQDNLLIKTLKDVTSHSTTYWPDLFRPVLTDEQALRNQKASGIKTSMLFPIVVQDKPIGVLIFSMSKQKSEVTDDEYDLIKSYSDVVGLAVQNSKLYSELKETQERELVKAKELLKLKDEFVFIATHDLKTPVTAIDGYISLIEEEQPEFPENIKSNFQAVKEASGRLKQLVNDLLQVAREESGTVKVDVGPVNINAIIDAAVREITPLAQKKNVSLITNIDQNKSMVKADEFKLPEIFENLLSNAVKFNKDGGSVTIKTMPQENHLEVTITDTGHGIPNNEQAKVFQKFFKYRSDSTQDVPGTGLGLFVVRMLIEKMEGKISFVSKEGVGTTFEFTLPLAG